MFLRRLLFVLLLASTPACIAPEEGALDEIEHDLSASNWSTSQAAFADSTRAQVATLNGTTYLVTTGEFSTSLYWRKRNADGTWTAPRVIRDQRTMDRVSLAAFNGYLYMFHVGESTATNIWFSRFDPATETWMDNILLPYTTAGGPPALAAFDNRLFIVGTDQADDGSYPMWVATMNASETFTSAMAIPRQFSASRPSLAVFANKLYMAHRHGSTGEIVYSTHNAGAAPISWTGVAFIRAAVNGAAIRGDDVSLAAVNGYLHLVHRRFDSNLTYWTYFNQCTWAPEVGIDTFESWQQLSLTTSSEGLALARGATWSFNGQTERATYVKTYFAPPAPEGLPQCLGAQ